MTVEPFLDWAAENAPRLMRAGLVMLASLLLARVASAAAAKVLQSSGKGGFADFGRRTARWAVIAMGLGTALQELGFDLGILMGAAGVVTVALGFAAQTSASNLISGLFLLFEGAVSVGDIIALGSTTGEVIRIDLLSIRLRTFDNLLVRIPNETVVKAEITNLTRHSIRRADIVIPVPLEADLRKIRSILQVTAQEHPSALRDPDPLFLVTGYGEFATQLQFSVWFPTVDFVLARTELYIRIREALMAHDVPIPIPHRMVQMTEAALPGRAE